MNDIKKISAKELQEIYKEMAEIEAEYYGVVTLFVFGNLSNRFIITPESSPEDYKKAVKYFNGYKRVILRKYATDTGEFLEENEINLNKFIELFKDNKEV